jgi:hypothetical protein
MRNHKYGKNISDNEYAAIQECIRCGCTRRINKGYGFSSISYIRNMIFFEKSPDCIDWKVENNKTID